MENEKNKINFEYAPNKKSEIIYDWAVTKINPLKKGLAMSELEKAIEENIPVVEHPKVDTHRNILYVSRYECPCCQTGISAIVRVSCTGLLSGEAGELRDKIEGLYSVYIGEYYGDEVKDCKTVVSVEKLEPKSICLKKHEKLPKRDYDSDQVIINKKIDGIYRVGKRKDLEEESKQSP